MKVVISSKGSVQSEIDQEHGNVVAKLVNRFKTTNRNYPVMIGCGKYDNAMAIKAANMWHESEPKSKMIVFENAGHLVNMDTPKEFNENLIRFLTGEL